ncbi:MAG: stage IV sporulation protein A [Christensenellales bacterium]|jgi:stage IV sporulation protein A
MEHMDLYRDIAERTNGDIYLGLVGPVRTGKSTFIKRFMELLVLPTMANPYERERSADEMPQSGTGRTIMTTQPHFVPNEAVELELGENLNVKMRLIDCVGYVVPGAVGTEEEGVARMVTTPWAQEDIPFEEAAEIGTKKVITDHATIGVVMLTDGSITDIPRLNYVAAEERVIADVKAQNKPYIIILNSRNPQSEDTEVLRQSLESKYGSAVKTMNVLEMTREDIDSLMGEILLEFPVAQIKVDLPKWVQVLPSTHPLPQQVIATITSVLSQVDKMRDYTKLEEAFDELETKVGLVTENLSLGTGGINFTLDVDPSMFYQVLSEQCGIQIDSDYQLMAQIKEMAEAKRAYDRLAGALESVSDFGYGFVRPSIDEMKLEEPEIVRRGGRFGVSLKASAPALHLSKVNIETEISPIMGTEKQSEELANYLIQEFENDPAEIWKTNIFGKSLHELVQEGISNKLMRMPEDVQRKMSETMQRIINDGRGGVLCVLL